MDVNSINPILQAFAEILPQIGFQEITKKGIALEGATLQNPGILINIGVMGPLTGVIGTLMAMEAIKLITGTGEPLIGRLLLYDGRLARFTEIGF